MAAAEVEPARWRRRRRRRRSGGGGTGAAARSGGGGGGAAAGRRRRPAYEDVKIRAQCAVGNVFAARQGTLPQKERRKTFYCPLRSKPTLDTVAETSGS